MSRGYYHDKNKQRYHVRVHRNGKNHHVGRFKTQREAEAARREFLQNYRCQVLRTSSEDSLSRILNSSNYDQAKVRA